MFGKILIANRGEIACRIMRTAQEMGIHCVAVYSDADRNAYHVEIADSAVYIGGSAPSESYLRGDAIIAAARQMGAEAIHPGYGFLSENPDFVDAVQAAGLVFVGPSAAAIRAMGLKDAAKTLMQEAGVPVVPGYHGANQDSVFLAAQAVKIGFPVLIKAVAGGGGKGMRKVETAVDFSDALMSAKSEALLNFGNEDVLVEKYVQKPRHIEIQVFGDGKNVVHLFERDCSLQRRHQKVMEEAPAPGMTAEMRKAMCAAAVHAAKSIGYKGAGTVEFIVDASEGLRPDRFWFMEMNTRLQVEHPVTEAIVGVDLVEWQLRVAAGEPLPKQQSELTISGHAFEARLYAEDAKNGFVPVSGTLSHLQLPDGARTDSGVQCGDLISPYYDPLIAKIITVGASRDIALLRLKQAIRGTEVAGTVTNLTFLGKLASHSDVMSGDVDTGLIMRNFDALTEFGLPPADEIALAAVCAAGLVPERSYVRGFSLWMPLEQRIYLSIAGQEHSVTLTFAGPEIVGAVVADQKIEIHAEKGSWKVSGARRHMSARRVGSEIYVFSDETWVFDIPDPLARNITDTVNSNVISAPMPGIIRAVFVQSGQSVVAGERLMVLEAMKMEHALVAPRDGVVAEINAKVGDQVDAGLPLITLRKDDNNSGSQHG
ncbi:MAG: ATP-binding protein [Paracoccaceae bacterium]